MSHQKEPQTKDFVPFSMKVCIIKKDIEGNTRGQMLHFALQNEK